MRKLVAIMLVLVLVAAIVFWYISSRPSVPVITEIERKLDPILFRDFNFVEPKVLESTYAENITLANASVRRRRKDKLLIDIDVANNGDKTVTGIWASAAFYNSDGRVASYCNADLGTNNVSNDAPIPPGSSNRVVIALLDLGNWTGGKMVVTIRGFETE